MKAIIDDMPDSEGKVTAWAAYTLWLLNWAQCKRDCYDDDIMVDGSWRPSGPDKRGFFLYHSLTPQSHLTKVARMRVAENGEKSQREKQKINLDDSTAALSQPELYLRRSTTLFKTGQH